MFDSDEVTNDELWELTTAEDLAERGEAQRLLGFRLSQAGKHDQVEGLYRAAIDTFTAIDSSSGVARTSYAFTVWLNSQERFTEAMECVAVALTGYDEMLRTEWFADALRQRGFAHQGLGQLDAAITDFKTAVDIYYAECSWYSAAFLQIELVNMLGGEDRQVEALRAADGAITLAQNSEDIELNIRAHDRRASALFDLGDYVLALDSLITAQDIAEHHRSEAAIRLGGFRIGLALLLLGRYDEALVRLTSAEDAYRATGDTAEASAANLERLKCLFALGRDEEAFALGRKIKAYSRALDDAQLPALAGLELAKAHLRVGELLTAEDEFASAQGFAEMRQDLRLDHLGRLNWAATLVEYGHYQRAWDLLEGFGVEYWGQGRVRKAQHLITRARARFYLEPDSLKAELDLQECLALGPAIGLAEYHAQCYELWADIRRIEGREADASVLTGHAIGLWLRAGRADRISRLGHWLIPHEYLTRVPSEEPIVNPAFTSAVVAEGAVSESSEPADPSFIDWELIPAFKLPGAGAGGGSGSRSDQVADPNDTSQFFTEDDGSPSRLYAEEKSEGEGRDA